MNTELMDACVASLEEDAAAMSQDRRDAFVALLPLLSKLYRDDATMRAVLVMADEEGQTIVRINANEYEANGLLHNALPFHEELLKASVPPTPRSMN